jgi:hypothetical protein
LAVLARQEIFLHHEEGGFSSSVAMPPDDKHALGNGLSGEYRDPVLERKFHVGLMNFSLTEFIALMVHRVCS